MNEDGTLVRIFPALSGRSLTVEDMDLEAAVRNALKGSGIHTVDRLLQLSGPELLRIFPNRKLRSYEDVIHCLVCLSEEADGRGTGVLDCLSEQDMGNVLEQQNILDEPCKTFNVFQAAGIWKSEEIHTSVIAELMNPQSAFHNMGAVFLGKFLRKLGVELSKEELEKGEVKTEVPTDQGRRIDMVISTERLYLPFEVKIWACDQDAQLWDYYTFAKKQGKEVPHVYYLTTDGHEPSPQSRTNPLNDKEQLSDEQICLLSFQGHILRWLEDCMKEPGLPSDVLETMKQLRDNIQGGPNAQVRSGVQRKCFSKWAKQDVLDALYQKLLTYDLPWTECTPAYMTLTLNKMKFGTASLEFALRIKKERVKQECEERVRLYLICGLTQEGGKPDYAAAGDYISEHHEAFRTLLKATFAEGGNTLELKTDPVKSAWNRLPEKACYQGLDADGCCHEIENLLKHLTPESVKLFRKR